MPTVAQLKNEIEETLGYTISSEKIISVFNECLKEDLASALRMETQATTELNEEFRKLGLPQDMLELIMVKGEKAGILNEIPLNETQSKGYILFGKVLEPQKIALPDKVTIYYYKYPKFIVTINDVPDIPMEYHHALKYYFISKYYKDDEEFELEEKYWADYQNIKLNIKNQTKKQKGMQKKRKIKVQPFI